MKNTCRCQRRLFVLLFAAASADFALGQVEETPDVKAMIERSLPYIHEAGMEWRNDKKCVSCHTATFTVWALNRAAESGLAVARKQLRDWNEWSRDWKNHVAEKRRDEADRTATLLAENDSVAQLLLGRSVLDDAKSDWVVEYRGFLAKSQNKDGSWKAGGQLPLQKRPKRETQEVSTMWALIAQQDSGAPKEIVEPAIAAAHKWLGKKTQGVSTEWWATRLLLQRFANESEADETRRMLLGQQHDDGGWGWLVEDESDALGTSIVLYALSRDGGTTADTEVSKALTFLKSSQDDDGSWPVNGTKKNSADDVTGTATYWGTCWAVIALADFVDQATADSVSTNTYDRKIPDE